MMRFYFNVSPNPMKVALLLEELELEVQYVPIDPRKGEQFEPWFLKINPNGKIPALEDDGITIFDSNAILLYLARKAGRYLGTSGPQGEADLYSWLMFVATGLSPFSGQAVHFRHMAPEAEEYAHRRYQFEIARHYGVVNERLADRPFMLGSDYSIVDMALWGWVRMADFVMGQDALQKFPHVTRWFNEVHARPAAIRAESLRARYSFKTSWDAESKKNMFQFQSSDEVVKHRGP